MTTILSPRRINNPLQSFGLNRQSAQAPGLVAWWPMSASRGIGLARDMVGSSNGVFNGNVVWGYSPTYGAVLDFAGGTVDYMAVGIPPGLPFGNNPRTITMWIRPNSFDTSTSDRFFSLDSGGNGQKILLFFEDNAVSWGFGGHRVTTPKSALSTGVWYHVAARVPVGATTTDDCEIIINGINQTLSLEAGSPQTLDTISTTVYIGGGAAGVGGANCAIADARLYNYAVPDAILRQMSLPGSMWDLYQAQPVFWPVHIPAAAPPGGVTIPVIINHLRNQGIL